ncbi:MAG: site-specific DNA-methyltransferase [Bacteroidota bacterium]
MRLLTRLAEAVKEVSTAHRLYLGDARNLQPIEDNSVHLVVTSPPYWTLKEYPSSPAQLGNLRDYEEFLAEIEKVWKECYRVLVRGGRMVIVVGDICLSRRKNKGRHMVMPLHASIQEQCRRIGFDNLAPIIWYKIANAAYEVENGSGFLGKPYEPNGIVKNDIEFILMQRKPGAYRKPTLGMRLLSIIGDQEHKEWFQQIWQIPGASTREHPAPFPLALADRLVRMYSFVGDTILDPFAGTGTALLAAMRRGRNSLGFEIDEHYHTMAERRLVDASTNLLSKAHFCTLRVVY